jgi:hypothetical protein
LPGNIAQRLDASTAGGSQGRSGLAMPTMDLNGLLIDMVALGVLI